MAFDCHIRLTHKLYVSKGNADTIQKRCQTFTLLCGKFIQDTIYQILSE